MTNQDSMCLPVEVQVLVIEATEVPRMDLFSAADPYVRQASQPAADACLHTQPVAQLALRKGREEEPTLDWPRTSSCWPRPCPPCCAGCRYATTCGCRPA